MYVLEKQIKLVGVTMKTTSRFLYITVVLEFSNWFLLKGGKMWTLLEKREELTKKKLLIISCDLLMPKRIGLSSIFGILIGPRICFM